MIWIILAFLGVPLWLCALGILMVFVGNRKLRKRHGDIPVRVRQQGKKRWIRGHAIWVSDVFAWRGSPAAWNEDLFKVTVATLRAADAEERKQLHRLGDDLAVATLRADKGESMDVATTAGGRKALVGPFESAGELV
jgi:hypothetical protein